jgi:2-keto-3-deoxy-L-rhamnonate aldolase RhmA
MKETFRKQLLAGKSLVGTIITLPCPEIAEIMVSSGFDWLFIDLEHTTLDLQSAQRLLQTVSPKAYGIIRCPANEEVWIKKCIDLGADGLILPQIRTKNDAERAVRYSKYPPSGDRSVGIARAQGYGANFQEYIDIANENIAIILQIEHIEAVENMDAILQGEGIDCVVVGPYDLSGSMGKIGQVTDPQVLEAISEVREACMRAGVPLGIFGATADAVQPYIEQGFKLITVGMDVMFLGSAARNVIDNLRS